MRWRRSARSCATPRPPDRAGGSGATARNASRGLEAWRRRLFEILEEGRSGDTTSVVVDRALIALIVVNVAAVVLETVDWLEAAHRGLFQTIEIVSVAIFTVEYALRVWVADVPVAPSRRPRWSARVRYCLRPSGIIDFLAIAPFYLGFFFPAGDLRYLRLFRLVRFLKLARYSPALGSLFMALASETRALIATAVIMLGMVLTAASALYLVEHAVQPDRFGSIPDAMWWAIATLTTVGYGDVVPVTVAGKVIGGLVMVFGLAMFALPIGIVATAFVQEIHRRDFVVTWGMVSKVPLFEELSAGEVAEVMKLLTARTAEPGDVVVREGDVAQSMFIVASGRVEVLLEEAHVELGDGAVFGEIAVLKRSRRSATVRALVRTRLLVLESGDLSRLMAQKPSIARRIRAVAHERVGRENVTARGDLASEEISPGEDG